MGLDLSLLVVSNNGQFAHTILRCTERSELFDDMLGWVARNVINLDVRPVADGFCSYLASADGNTEYGEMRTDKYGEPLLTIPARALYAAYREHVGITEDAYNRAIWAFLGALPPATRIALHWE